MVAAPVMEFYYKATDETPLFTRYAIRKLCSNCNFSYAKAERELGYHTRSYAETMHDEILWLIRTGKYVPAGEKSPARPRTAPARG